MTGLTSNGLAPARAPVQHMASVEVKKGVIWYEAVLLDVDLEHAIVGFGGIWPDRKVLCNVVRQRPPRQALPSRLLAGAPVEVRFDPTDTTPGAWWPGTVLSHRDLVKVAIEGANAAQGAEISVQIERVRLACPMEPLDPLLLVRKAVPIDSKLHAWLLTNDAKGCLEQVRVTAGLNLAIPGSVLPGVAVASPGSSGHDKPDAVVLLGDDSSVRVGEMLVQIHMFHQREVELFHLRRNGKIELLQRLSQRTAGDDARLSFEVDPSLMGRTIGKGRERINKIEKELGVEIRVVKGESEEMPGTVQIMAETDELALQARKLVELHRQQYDVDPDQMFYVCGSENRHLLEISKKAGLAGISASESSLELCGISEALEAAVMLLDSHCEYFQIYQEMGRVNEEIDRSFEELLEETQAASFGGLGRSGRRRTSDNSQPVWEEGKGGKTGLWSTNTFAKESTERPQRETASKGSKSSKGQAKGGYAFQDLPRGAESTYPARRAGGRPHTQRAEFTEVE